MNEFKKGFISLIDKTNPNYLTGDLSYNLFGVASIVEGSAPADLSVSLDLGIVKFDSIKIVDYSSLKTAVDFFRPIINGFLGILLGMFYYREFLSFIGQAPNMASARQKANEEE